MIAGYGELRSHEEISGMSVLTSNDGFGGWRVSFEFEIVVRRTSHWTNR